MGKIVPFRKKGEKRYPLSGKGLLVSLIACFLILLDVWVLSPEQFAIIPKIILSLLAVILISLCFGFGKKFESCKKTVKR